MSKEPGLREFLSAVGNDALGRASGALSVPFTALAAFRNDAPTKILFTVLAIIAFLVACYKTWSKERQSKRQTEIALGQLTLELKDEREDRLRPELFLQESSATSDEKFGFKIVNRGRASAVKISSSTMSFGSLKVTAGVQSGVVHAGEDATLVFMVETKGAEGSLTPAFNGKELVRAVSSQMEATIVERDFRIVYQDTDNRMFKTEYRMGVDSILETLNPFYLGLSAFP